MTFTGSTPQEMFDYVWNHMNKQRKRSVDTEHDVCAYKDQDGNMCAVGCLFNEKEMEAYGNVKGDVGSVISRDKYGKGCLRPFYTEHRFLLEDLQLCHDTMQDLHSEEKRMKKFYSDMVKLAEKRFLQHNHLERVY